MLELRWVITPLVPYLNSRWEQWSVLFSGRFTVGQRAQQMGSCAVPRVALNSLPLSPIELHFLGVKRSTPETNYLPSFRAEVEIPLPLVFMALVN